MNANVLARQYHTLTAWERYPLLQAAIDRGDDAEAERLANSAPRRTAQVAHYYGIWEGLTLLSGIHMMRQLHCVCGLFAATGLAGSKKIEKREANERLRVLSRRFVVDADAWKLFCADLRLDPDATLRQLPGFDLMRDMEEAARTITADAVDGPAAEESTQTAADVAREMRAFLAERAQRWQ